ncbi:MAG: hypothetical protein JSV43_08360 [Methanobacteriota archaeon]|nr:MAG: hypothetical protein JSV43_08360 [Euryarchaeota archaeon]
MAHRGKKGKKYTELKKKEEERARKRKALVAAFIVIALVFASALAGLYLTQPGPDDQITPPKFEIEFPRDEGQHNDSYEFWKVDFLLQNLGGDKFAVNVDYAIYENGDQKRFASLTDEGNISGQEFYAAEHDGSLMIGYEKLNLTFVSPYETDTWNGEYATGFDYDYRGRMEKGGAEVYDLNVQMTSMKDPILLGENGTVLLKNETKTYGTIRGYSITRLTVTGTLEFSDQTHTVNGYAWIQHHWGGWTLFDMEEYRFHLSTASELHILRFYDPTSGGIFKEIAYYSKPNEQIIKLELADYTVDILRYWVDPRFLPSTERCLPSQWDFHLTGVGTHISLSTSSSNQLDGFHWEGSVVISGIIEGISASGRGFAILNHPYFSVPAIETFYRDDDNPANPKLYANITNLILMDNATLHYQIDASPWSSEAMTLISGDSWMATITVSAGNNVKAYVEAYDLAGNRVATDPPMEWTV